MCSVLASRFFSFRFQVYFRNTYTKPASYTVDPSSCWTSCSVQNVTACVVVTASRCDYITPIVETICDRLWQTPCDRPAPTLLAQQNYDSLLSVRRARLPQYDDWTFSITACRLWNNFPHICMTHLSLSLGLIWLFFSIFYSIFCGANN